MCIRDRYITIRFDKKYALFALLALFHDLFIVFGIFSWLGIILSVEVNSLFAVSLLTIAGYSVNDTVVIFDRIRENLKSKKEGYNETIQLSVNESFRRTTFTSITTLIPLLSIILFGSYSLFWFSLALSLGIIVGSYSSILLAPSMLLKDWGFVSTFMKLNYYLMILFSLVLIDLSTELRILFDHFTFSSLYFAIGKHPLAIFILFSYPYLYKKLIK